MKRQKMRFEDMNAIGIQFFDFHRVHNANNEKGYRYILCNPLTPEQVAFIQSFKNTIISECHCKYAPEIRHNTLIILNKCKK